MHTWTSVDQILLLTLNDSGGTVYYDELEEVPPASIPTLSEWGIIILMNVFLGIGVMVLRKRVLCGQTVRKGGQNE